MDAAGRAPRRPVRRPLRVTLSPSTAWLVNLLLRAREGNEAWLAANRRSLPLELQMALDEDLADLEYVAGWYQRHAVSDVGQTDILMSDMGRGSSHEEITTAEAAGELGVKPRTVLRWADQGLLEGRRVNARSVLVTRASVNALREARSAA
jgi:excisionase family DNA binding protein